MFVRQSFSFTTTKFPYQIPSLEMQKQKIVDPATPSRSLSFILSESGDAYAGAFFEKIRIFLCFSWKSLPKPFGKDFLEKQRKILIFSKNAPVREFLRNTTLWRKTRLPSDFFYVRAMYIYFGRKLHRGCYGAQKYVKTFFFTFFLCFFKETSCHLPAERDLKGEKCLNTHKFHVFCVVFPKHWFLKALSWKNNKDVVEVLLD